MLKKKDRTLDAYVQAGAETLLFRELSWMLRSSIYKIALGEDIEKMRRALRQIDEVISKADENLYSDFPDVLGDVFYGCIGNTPRAGDEVEKERIKRIRKIAGSLFALADAKEKEGAKE